MDHENDNKLSSKLSLNSNDVTNLYKQAISDQNINYFEGNLTIFREALNILNENIELKNVSFINFVNKLGEKITKTKADFSSNLNDSNISNKSIINLNGMKIKENKKRVYEDVENFKKLSFEEEKNTIENNENPFVNPLLPHTFKKLKDF